MKIAIDATEAFWPTLTGTGVYTRQLVRHLLALTPREDYTVLGIRSAETDTTFAPPEVTRLLRSPRYRSVWSQLRLPLHLLAHHYDLLHVPGHKLPVFCRCKTAVTIHDLAFLRFPQTFKPLHRQRLVWFTRNAVRRADRIIAISESTKRDLCSLFTVPADRIDVVHHGVDHALFRADGAPAKRAAPYILSVGTLQPRKNYSLLFRAFKKVCETWREPLELVIVGQPGWMWEPIEAEAKASPVADRIHWLGYVPDEELPPLYRGATLVAMPSLYEGFGLPLLEAMACGAPVIASSASCFPEVCGDAARLIDPTDEQAWADAMRELLGDAAKRNELRRLGLARATTFTWHRTAEQTLAVYHRVVAS